MKNTIKLLSFLFAVVFLGFGCSSAPDSPTELAYDEVLLKKISFAVDLPKDWKENPLTADPEGPADFQEFYVPLQEEGEDKVAGTMGFRLVPRIGENTLLDEVEKVRPFVVDSAGSDGMFAAYASTTMAANDALEMRWQGITKNDVEEVWYYTFAFVDDDLLVAYYFDETADAETFYPVFQRAISTLEKR